MSETKDIVEERAANCASRIENYFMLDECGRRDGKTPFELAQEDISRLIRSSIDRTHNEAIAAMTKILDEYDVSTADRGISDPVAIAGFVLDELHVRIAALARPEKMEE